MRSFTDCCAPRPSASIAITADTPITMPSMVRSERSLLARRASIATENVSTIGTSDTSALLAAPAALGPQTTRHAAGRLFARLGLLLDARRLRLNESQHHHLLSFLHARCHLREVEVAEPELHAPGLDPGRTLHEHDLRATGSAAGRPANRGDASRGP